MRLRDVAMIVIASLLSVGTSLFRASNFGDDVVAETGQSDQ